nr:tetratricopeptide repeat protein [Hankyongella ginsenosidimutans]
MTTLIDLRASNFKVAEASAKRLIATYPKLPIGYNMLGAAYLGLNNLKFAEANFRKSLEMKPDYHEARRNLAQLLVAQKRFDEARRELLRVLDTDRGNLRTMLALSNLAGQQNKTDEQLDWLRKAVGANPQSLQPRLALVQTYLKLGDKKGALNEATSWSVTSRRIPRRWKFLRPRTWPRTTMAMRFVSTTASSGCCRIM